MQAKYAHNVTVQPKADTNDGPEGETRFCLRVSAAVLIVSSGGTCSATVGLGSGYIWRAGGGMSAKVRRQTPTHTKEQRPPQARKLLDVDTKYT